MSIHPTPQIMSYVVMAIVIAIVFTLRIRGMKRARRLRLGTLWIVPAVYLLATITVMWRAPPHGLHWLWLAIALALGGAIGWHRAKLMRITIDPATGTLNQQASPAALFFIVALILVRSGLRYEANTLGLDIMQMTDLLMTFGLGLFSATRVEMFIRARQLLGQRAA